jgi:hypothetical protein
VVPPPGKMLYGLMSDDVQCTYCTVSNIYSIDAKGVREKASVMIMFVTSKNEARNFFSFRFEAKNSMRNEAKTSEKIGS